MHNEHFCFILVTSIGLYFLMTLHLKGIIYAVISAIAYGFLALFGKHITGLGVSNETMLCWRFLISFIVLACLFPKHVFIHLKIDPIRAFFAIIGFIASAYFYFLCADCIGSGLAMAIFFIYPVVLAIFNFIFLKENIYLSQKIGMILSLIALLFLSDFSIKPGSSMALGLIYGALGGVGYALYVFMTKNMAPHPFTLTAWVCFCAGIFFLGQAYITQTFVILPKSAWIDLVCLVVFCTLTPIILFLKAVEYIGGIKASLLSIVEPATTTVLGIIFLGEHLTYLQCFGLLLMAVAIIVIEAFSLCKRALSSMLN